MNLKKCSKCKKIKPLSEFYADARYCKSCHQAWGKEWRKKHPERWKEISRRAIKKYAKTHAKKIYKYRMNRYRTNKGFRERILARNKRYYYRNKDKILAKRKAKKRN